MKNFVAGIPILYAVLSVGCGSNHQTHNLAPIKAMASSEEAPTRAPVDDPAMYWDPPFLRHELVPELFESPSGELFINLVRQERAWQTGLIHYLGLNRFTGQVIDTVNRTVWWSTSVSAKDGSRYRLYLADRTHTRLAPDASAYIVTDEDYQLVHWEGTQIYGNMTHHHSAIGDQLPLKLSFTHESFHNNDTSRPTYTLSLDGIQKVR